MSYSGTVTIKVVSVSNVPVADANGSSDPYVIITVGKTEQKTSEKSNNLNPVFNESIALPP